jgi:putative peptidoglycan lipid II flippase
VTDNDNDGGSSPSLARSSAAMAVGTLASRLTGFLRTVVIAAAMGLTVAESYNVANTIPNILYDLLLGGVLTSVVVPLLVQAAHDDGDNGEAYAQRLVTIVGTTLLVAAAIGVALAPQIVALYAHRLDTHEQQLAVTFARYFLPQVVFYGLGAVFGAILNTRGSFAAPMWAPVLNNLVVIVAGAIFFAITIGRPEPGQLSTTQTLLLALGTTGGIVVQTIALLPALRRVGFRLSLRWDWRGAGLRKAGPFAAWILGYVATNQVGYVVIVNLATAAGRAQGPGGSGYSPYTFAFILFSLPYAVVAVSVITALFPRMSRDAVEADKTAVAEATAGGLNLSAVLLVPSTVALVALGPLLATVVFAHGNVGLSGARLIGGALAGFGIGLVPFSAFQIQLRAWLAMRDSRTPFLVNVAITAVNIGADVVLYLLLPPRAKVVGLAVGFSLSYAVGTLVFAALLRRRIGRAERRDVGRTHARLAVAGLLAAIPTYAAARLLTAGLGLGAEAAFVACIAGGLIGAAVFLGAAQRLRVAELAELRGLLLRRLRPG